MHITHETFSEILGKQSKVHILDFREPSDFAKEHVKGSINIPLATLQLASHDLYAPLKKEHVYVITHDLTARDALNELEKRGFENVHHVRSSIDEIMFSVPHHRKGGLRHETITIPS